MTLNHFVEFRSGVNRTLPRSGRDDAFNCLCDALGGDDVLQALNDDLGSISPTYLHAAIMLVDPKMAND